jgi:hypothetical protein
MRFVCVWNVHDDFLSFIGRSNLNMNSRQCNDNLHGCGTEGGICPRQSAVMLSLAASAR